MFESTFQIDLGADVALLRDAVRDFAQHEIAPRAADDRPRQRVPGRPVAQARRARRDGAHRRRGLRRHRSGLPGAHGGDGRDQPRQRVGGPELRRALQPVRQPDPPQRQRGAEEEIPAQADQRRARRRTGDERAGRRLRCGQHDAEGRAAWRPLPAQRQQDVDHQRRRRRHRDRLRQDRPADGRARHDGVHRREGLQGLQPRPAPRQARHARLQHLPPVLRGLRGAGRQRDGRRRCRCQDPDERARLRTRGAVGRAAGHHGRLHGRRWCPTCTSASSSARASASSS